MKDINLNQLNNLQLIRKLQTFDSISSDQSALLFSRYATDSFLEISNLSKFLLDLLRANSLPPIVSHEALFSVLGEFALDITQKTVISSEEFNNFFVYCHPKPFSFLLDVQNNSYAVPLIEFIGKTLLISFYTNNQSEMDDMNVANLEKELFDQMDRRFPSSILQVIAFFSESRKRFDAIIIVIKDKLIEIHDEIRQSPIKLYGHTVRIKRYEFEILPRPPKIDNHLTSAAASALCWAERASRSASKFVNNLKESENAQRLRRSVEKITADVETNAKLSQMQKSFSDTISV